MRSRRSSPVLVEGNYTYNAKNTVAFLYDTSGASPGTWNLADKTYVLCDSPNTTSTGDYRPTYAWTAEPSAGINTSVPPTVGVGIVAVP